MAVAVACNASPRRNHRNLAVTKAAVVAGGWWAEDTRDGGGKRQKMRGSIFEAGNARASRWCQKAQGGNHEFGLSRRLLQSVSQSLQLPVTYLARRRLRSKDAIHAALRMRAA